ncbi:MAG: hypothetical protein R2749_05020 [Acidimicrobiales bacterium]
MSALLKYWRRQRGLSQLDSRFAADVSARHVSFLETGRSRPSADARGCARHRPRGAAAPGRRHAARCRHDPVYERLDGVLPAAVSEAIGLLKEHHEPFPLMVINRTYDVLDVELRRAAAARRRAADPAAGRLNLARSTFDFWAHPFIANIDEVGRQLLWRIQREVLADPADGAMQDLLDERWRCPPSIPTGGRWTWRCRSIRRWCCTCAAAGSRPALVMVTAFEAPQNIDGAPARRDVVPVRRRHRRAAGCGAWAG